jgi:MinD superfamily P-loop ATPase
MRLAIASGKGGTGKTTLAVALANLLPECWLLDADVEEPNAKLFINCTEQNRQPVMLPVPQVETSLCTACGECVRFCRFNALALVGGKIMVFGELCHGCGGCTIVCPTQAISEHPTHIGDIALFTADGFTLAEGRMNIGRVGAPLVIRRLLSTANNNQHTIIDCPPGTSCNMVTAVRDADFTLLVTEATPFGLQDLTLAVNTLRLLGKKFAVVVNRADLGDDRVRKYCADENIKLLLEIPYSRTIAEAIASGKTMLDGDPELRTSLKKLLADVGINVGGAA